MRKHIPFGGMTTTPTDHEAHEGDSALALHLLAEDEALRPIGLTTTPTTTLPPGSRLALLHRHGSHTHAIIERTTSDGTEYRWIDTTDATEGTPLLTTATAANSLCAVGSTLCLIFDDGITYCVWEEARSAYRILHHDDLLYRLTITQDGQQHQEVSLPIEGRLLQYLDHPDEPLATLPTLPGRLFEGFIDGGAYATGATMVATQAAVAIDSEAARAGEGTFHHACLGIATLRLRGGGHLLCSNLFGLWPAAMSDTLTADRTAGTLTWSGWFHRHFLTVNFPNPDAVACVATGIDIYLTPPLSFLDLHKSLRHTATTAGLTTSLTFAPLDHPALLHLLDSCTFHWSMTVDITQAGQPVMMRPASVAAPAIDLSDLRRGTFGARLAVSHSGQLTIGQIIPIVHHPMEIAIDYRYGDTIAGIRPDTGGTAGRTAQLVVKATTCDVTRPEVWWQGEVAYPLAGMMMAPGKMFRQMEYHLKIEETDGTHYYTFSQPLDALNDKSLSTAVYATTGGIHGASQPIWQSLVIQQTKMLTYDPTTETETVSQLLWEEETATDFDQHLLQARHAWTMARQPSTLRTATEHPLYFPPTTETRVGGGELHALTPHLRRSADGLFGDGQFDAFCSDGIYLLRQNGGRWRAQQSIQRTSLLPDTLPLAVEGGTVFLSARGVMLLKGSEAKCLSDNLGDAPFSPSVLPHFGEIVATEHDIPEAVLHLPHWKEEFFRGAHLLYDPSHHRLWLYNPSCDDSGQRRWPIALACSLRFNTWGFATTTIAATATVEGEQYAIDERQGETVLSRIDFQAQKRWPVLLCTRPWTLGPRYRHATVSHLIVRGLFLDRGAAGSHIGVALYGSNDLHHWQLVGTSAAQYLRRLRGTPYKWFRLVAIGRLLPTESLEEVSIC